MASGRYLVANGRLSMQVQGAEGGTPELYFTDPDGLAIQLQNTTYCGGGGFLGELCPSL